MTFGAAWWLLLMALIPLLWWRWRARRRQMCVPFSSAAAVKAAGQTWAVHLRWLPPLLRTGAILLLVICIARPQKPNEQTRQFTEGIAVQLVIDRSGSMRAEDFELDGRRVNRLEAVKSVVNKFVLGGDELEGRPNDLIGMIAFATYADSLSPLTLDHEHLIDALAKTDVASEREESGTAIGDAIALGVERLHDLKRRSDLRGADNIKSRIMILLTDGEHNAGDIDPMTAAEMANAFGIKIYTIGAGTRDSFAPVPYTDMFGRQQYQRAPVSIDETTLKAIAAATGGQYFRATDTDSLASIYKTIDELEKTEIEQRRYMQFKEMSLESVELGFVQVPPLLIVVFLVLCLEMFLSYTKCRVLP